MATIMEMERVLREFTNDPTTLAEFYEAAAKQLLSWGQVAETEEMLDKAKAERRQFLECRVADKRYQEAVEYHKRYDLLPQPEFRALVRKWCEHELPCRPLTALDIAREHNLPDLVQKAAHKCSEEILASNGTAAETALKIARHERADDQDYVRRAARYAYVSYIRGRNFYNLPLLLAEFPFFSDEEMELARFLARAAKEQDEERERQRRAQR